MHSPGTRSRQSTLAGRVRHPQRLLVICTMLVGLMLIGPRGASAWQGTPTADPDIVSPAECTVEPRSEDDLRALFREAAATPMPALLEASPMAGALAGTPADEQTVAEVTATWRMAMACLSAGDQPRMFAVFSDNMVRRQLLIDIAFGVTEDALFAFFAATPVAIPADQLVALPPFTEVLLLPDGRVAAIGPGDQGRGDVRIFVKDGDRWIIGDWFDLS